jgi:hypothetical protein
MRKLLVTALTLALALALAACNAPPMKEFAYPAWGFAISFWSPPQVTETPAAAGQPHSLLLDTKQAGREFAISVEEGVRPDVTIDQIGPFFARTTAQPMGGDVGPMTYVSTAQGVLGREFAITQNGKPLATIRTFLANDRFYEIVVQSALGPDDPAVKDFLGSFRVTAAPPAVPPPPANGVPAGAAPTNAP